jgi:hypothetical protein
MKKLRFHGGYEPPSEWIRLQSERRKDAAEC